MCQINSVEVYDWIRWAYIDLTMGAAVLGLNMDNVAIFVRQEVKAALDLKDNLTVGFANFKIDVPVVVDDRIVKVIVGEDSWKSDILIYSPDWVEDEVLDSTLL